MYIRSTCMRACSIRLTYVYLALMLTTRCDYLESDVNTDKCQLYRISMILFLRSKEKQSSNVIAT